MLGTVLKEESITTDPSQWSQEGGLTVLHDAKKDGNRPPPPPGSWHTGHHDVNLPKPTFPTFFKANFLDQSI